MHLLHSIPAHKCTSLLCSRVIGFKLCSPNQIVVGFDCHFLAFEHIATADHASESELELICSQETIPSATTFAEFTEW